MIVMTVEMIDKDTRRMSIEELEQMRKETSVKTVEIIEKLSQRREEIPVMVVEVLGKSTREGIAELTREDMAVMITEMTDENTGERFTEELELKREEVPVKTVERIVEKMEDVREEPEGPGR